MLVGYKMIVATEARIISYPTRARRIIVKYISPDEFPEWFSDP